MAVSRGTFRGRGKGRGRDRDMEVSAVQGGEGKGRLGKSGSQREIVMENWGTSAGALPAPS